MKYKIIFFIVTISCLCLQPIYADQRHIKFAGYDWLVKKDYYGPGPNYWNDSKKAVFKDKKNNLHLFVRKRKKQWQSAEIFLTKSLGYGKYSFTVKNRVDKLDRNLVLGLFLYANDEHELDIELSRWKNKKGHNLQFVAQPYYIEDNIKKYHLKLNNADSKYIIDWQPERIIFSVRQKHKKIYSWQYTGDYNFVPGQEAVHINFWQYENSAPFGNKKQEVIIKNFSFKK